MMNYMQLGIHLVANVYGDELVRVNWFDWSKRNKTYVYHTICVTSFSGYAMRLQANRIVQ